MTWRELARQVLALPKEVQGEEACVWLPLDYDRAGGEFPEIIGLCAFDGSLPYSADNLPSINIEEA